MSPRRYDWKAGEKKWIWVIFTERLAFVFRNIRVVSAPPPRERIESILRRGSRWEQVLLNFFIILVWSGNDILMAIFPLKRTYLWKQKEEKKKKERKAPGWMTGSSQARDVEMKGLVGKRQ